MDGTAVHIHDNVVAVAFVLMNHCLFLFLKLNLSPENKSLS